MKQLVDELPLDISNVIYTKCHKLLLSDVHEEMKQKDKYTDDMCHYLMELENELEKTELFLDTFEDIMYVTSNLNVYDKLLKNFKKHYKQYFFKILRDSYCTY